jgi:hypothetical protein
MLLDQISQICKYVDMLFWHDALNIITTIITVRVIIMLMTRLWELFPHIMKHRLQKIVKLGPLVDNDRKQNINNSHGKKVLLRCVMKFIHLIVKHSTP